MKKVYLVCSQANCFSDLDHEVIAAFSTFDKAEDLYLKLTEQNKDRSKEFLIETIALDRQSGEFKT